MVGRTASHYRILEKLGGGLWHAPALIALAAPALTAGIVGAVWFHFLENPVGMRK